MENFKEKHIVKKKIIKARNYIGPVTFKLLSKNKNLDLIKFFKENSTSKSQSNSTSKEYRIKRKGDFLLSNSEGIHKKLLISHSQNNNKNKEDKNIKKILVLPNQTYYNISNYQWKNKYHTKINSSNFGYINTEKNMIKITPNKSSHISEYYTEYNNINQKKKSNTIKNWYYNKNNNLKEFQKFSSNDRVNNEKIFNDKNEEYKESRNGENDLYHKLENIKMKCHHLLNNFSIIVIHLANEVGNCKNEIYYNNLKNEMFNIENNI